MPSVIAKKWGDIVVTDHIVDEVFNYLLKRDDFEVAFDAAEALVTSPSVRLEFTDELRFRKAFALLKRYIGLSFTDAISVVLSEEENISNICSFDDIFDRIPHLKRVH